jgi:hypothetical protein
MLSGSNSNSCRGFAEYEFPEEDDAVYLCVGNEFTLFEDAVDCPPFERERSVADIQPVLKELPKKPVVKSKQKGGEVALADRVIRKVTRKKKNAFTLRPKQSDINALLDLSRSKRNHKVG